MSKFTLPYTPVLMSVDKVAPAVYNPREADAMRLEYLRMSISHLGFVLPLYATPEGHLLSGHQRLTVAKMLGVKNVPVCVVEVKEDLWKQANLLFNRSTNDMDPTTNSEIYLNELEGVNLDELVGRLKPKVPDTDDFYPCMFPKFMTGEEITDAGMKVYSSHATGSAHRLLDLGVVMPALRDLGTGKIVNGSYRVYAGIERQVRKGVDVPVYPVVELTQDQATLAEVLVNLISMKFTVENQFADLLRYGGYRRPENKVEDLVVAFRYWADGKKAKSAKESLKSPPKFWHGFRETHGSVVADMGAGQRRNGLILRKKGIKCVDWEPYPCDWQGVTGENADKPSLTLSRQVANEFLDEIEAGVKFDSMFANAVINSIPFHKDRMAFFALVHACCSFHTGFYGTAKALKGMRLLDTLPLNRIDEDGKVHEARQQAKFQVPYESGVLLADISKAPKIQKHHTEEGLQKMLKTFWTVGITHYSGGLYMFYEAHHPRRVNPYVLREALEMEFNMPYPNNESINLHERAIKIFSARHNIDLADPKYAPAKEEDPTAVKEPEAEAA